MPRGFQNKRRIDLEELPPGFSDTRKDFFRFLLRKGWDLIFTLFLMSLIVFLLFYIIPSDPIAMMLGTEGSPERKAALEKILDIDKPLVERYLNSVLGLFSKDNPSLSIRFQKPVGELILPRLALSFNLAVLAFILVTLIAVPLAILSALSKHRAIDSFFSYLSDFFLAIPGFFLGIVLIIIFAFVFKQFQVGHYVPFTQGFWPHLKSLFLPALALALPKVAQAQQFYRTALLKTKEEDFIRTVKAKGASPFRLVFHHLLRNSLIPLVTSLGLIFADLITGSLIVEQVFVLPGAGRILLTAIEARDFPLAQGLILVIAAAVIIINALVDLLNALIDPRIVSPEAAVMGGEDGHV